MIAYDKHQCTICFNCIAETECKNYCITYCISITINVGNRIEHNTTSF